MKIASLSFAHLMPSANSSSSDSWCAQPLLWIRTIGCQLKSSAPHQIPPGPRPQHCNIPLCFVLISLSRTPLCGTNNVLLHSCRHKSQWIFLQYSTRIVCTFILDGLLRHWWEKSLTQFCSILLKMKCMKYGIFIFWSKLSNMKEVLCNNKCMCDVRACFTAILYQAYIWSSDWAPVVGTIYHLLLLLRFSLLFIHSSAAAVLARQ